MIDETILDLKRDFVCEALDLAYTHMAWTSRHLQHHRDKEALATFELFLSAARSAADEMKSVRASVREDALTSEAATEYRRARESRVRPKSQNEPPPADDKPSFAEASP